MSTGFLRLITVGGVLSFSSMNGLISSPVKVEQKLRTDEVSMFVYL